MILKKFPNFRQAYEYDCGPTALQTVFAYFGIDEKLEEIIKSAKTTEDGTSVENMKATAEKYGFTTELAEMKIADVKNYLRKKIPVVLLIQAWGEGHYVIAIGYKGSKIIFEDPASIYRTSLSEKELQERWHDLRDGKKWINCGIAIFGKKPVYNPNKIICMN